VYTVKNGVSTKINVVVIHNVRVLREGLANLLLAYPDLMVAETNEQIIERTSPDGEPPVDVVLLDAGSGPTDLAQRLQQTKGQFSGAKVIVVGVPQVASDILASIEAGASAYTQRDSSSEHLVDTIRQVCLGEVNCPPEISALLIERVASLKRQIAPDRHNRLTQLTPRELEILQRVSEGKSNKEIASELSLELQTVKNYVHKILEKLQVQNRRDAAIYAQNAAVA